MEGTVSYQADPARPWRYARYYVKQPKTGELAEAVVALRAKPVADASRPPETVTIDQQNFQFTPETVVPLLTVISPGLAVVRRKPVGVTSRTR